MGEFLQRDVNDPHYVPDSKGASGDTGKYLQAVALAQSSGRSVEECLAFLGVNKPEGIASVNQLTSVPTPVIPLPVEESEVADEEVKALAPKKPVKEVPADGFVVTEVIDPKDASELDLAKISELEAAEEENNWDGKIREGSKVRVTYSVPGSRIKWQGKIGTVVRVIGNEKAKVYEVAFKGQKIPKIRLNKKTGKLEKGYENKRLVTTFDTEDIELYS